MMCAAPLALACPSTKKTRERRIFLMLPCAVQRPAQRGVEYCVFPSE